ncbi:hypothetical protein [Vibrio algicola]|uniref:Outer membrane protein beta-barrel domain-containing protein n=1 Tax=Vibrio algicola TaxID=2662262 RepID=A0A5Q0TEI1_9VIBR|nr:hypothetical protein [Vibrio algicola]
MFNQIIISFIAFTALLSTAVGAQTNQSHASNPQSNDLIGPQENPNNDRMFPIWGKEARDRGYVLPKTYGLSLSYFSMDQPININSINLSGPIKGLPNKDLSTVSNAIFDQYLDISDAKQEATNVTLRADMWLFPFLNVYGLVGVTDGTSSAPITCKSGRPTRVIGNPLAPIMNQICGKNPDETRRIGTFDLDYRGTTYGVGMTVAGGVGNWFTIVDMNYSRTELDILDGQIDSVVISPRIGYRFMPLNKELRVWVGAMYQGVQQEMGGELNDILSGQLRAKVNQIAPDGKFNVKQELESEWNTTLGFNYVLNSTWDVITEFGFGERTSAFAGLEYRY